MNTERTEPITATYLHEKAGRLGIPVSGTFELTSRCNFNCPMCYVHSCENDRKNIEKELTTQQWISLAQQACDMGMMFALITGGEPFLRDDFFDIYSAMRKMGLMLSINTNGSLLKGDILEKLIDNPPFRMNVSLYGGCADTYCNMCGSDSFSDVTQGILLLKEAGVDVRLNLSLTPYNKEDMKAISDFAKDNGIHIKFNTYMYPPYRLSGVSGTSDGRFSSEEAALYSHQWDMHRMDEETFSARCDRILQYSSYCENECNVSVEEGVRCRAGRSGFWITWDGRLLPCGMMTSPSVSLDAISFSDAWEIIKEQSMQLTLPSECVSCPKRKVCNICAAVCVAETGDIKGTPEYMCKYTDELIRLAKEHLQKR